MRLTIGELRCLIREAVMLAPNERSTYVAQELMDAVDGYVASLSSGLHSDEMSGEVKDLARQAASLAKLMIRRRDRNAEKFARFAKLALDVTDNVGFWKRPTFLGKNDYVRKVRDLSQRLRAAGMVLGLN